MEAYVVFVGAGALGGFLRFLNWKIENPNEKVSYYKVLRNLIVGGICGYAIDMSALTALTAGLSGEWFVQNLGSKAYNKISKKE